MPEFTFYLPSFVSRNCAAKVLHMLLLRNVWGFSNSSMTRSRLSVLHGVLASLARISNRKKNRNTSTLVL